MHRDRDDVNLLSNGSVDHSIEEHVSTATRISDSDQPSVMPSVDFDNTREKNGRIECIRLAQSIVFGIFVVGSILNFMVCLILYIQDFDFFGDVKKLWMPATCVVLRQACSCKCCMLSPIPPCICPFRFTKPDRCSLICPLQDTEPPLDSNCSAAGRKVQTMESYWSPGSPTCFMKFHRSAVVEYMLGDELRVSNIYDVSSMDNRLMVYMDGSLAERILRADRRGRYCQSGPEPC
jgi:hypothetical protein